MSTSTKIGLPKFILIIPLIIAIGIALAGYYISNLMVKSKIKERYVTVKGLAERQVVADLAIWPITIREAGDNVAAINQKLEENINTVKNFLLENGIKNEEIVIDDYKVTDLLASNFRPDGVIASRYNIVVTILVKTLNIEAVKKASDSQSILAQKGIVFGTRFDYEPAGPFYEFTGFNAIKGDILSEAIKNARNAADQFAKDANCKIGALRRGNQGSFSVSSADNAITSSDETSNVTSQKKSINKKIRAVTTLEYELE